MISIIIPVYNDADALRQCLVACRGFQQQGHQLIVVDGGSDDCSLAVAQAHADKWLCASRGRAAQMNHGADVADGDLLVFLHADTSLPATALQRLEALAGRRRDGLFWGRFDVRLSGRQRSLRLIERAINWRSRLTSVATGDQAMFISKALFTRTGGFPDLALMEDIAYSKILRRHVRPCCFREPVLTSSRRWEENGVWSTVWLMWKLRLYYFFGMSPERLARLYR